MSRPIPKELFERGKYDPYVHRALQHWLMGGTESFEAMLIALACELSRERERQEKALQEAERLLPGPVLVVPAEKPWHWGRVWPFGDRWQARGGPMTDLRQQAEKWMRGNVVRFCEADVDSLTRWAESIRREALEEAAKLCEGDDIDYQFRGTRHSPTIFNREMFAWAIRARSRATTKEDPSA